MIITSVMRERIDPHVSDSTSYCTSPPYNPVVDLGEGPGGPGQPLFWMKKEQIPQRRKANRASKTKPPFLLCSEFGSTTVTGPRGLTA